MDEAERQDRIYSLIGKAEYYYKKRRFRRAMAACDELDALDPENMIAEQMRDGCVRILQRRRAIIVGTTTVILLAALGIAAVYINLLRVRAVPSPGTLRVRERHTQAFRFRSPLSVHRSLEFTWTLLDADGKPVLASERPSLKQDDDAPWVCAYTPPYYLVKASDGGQPLVRRVVASGVGPDGDEVLAAEWRIEVVDSPSAPMILATDPPTAGLIGIVAAKEKRTFRVEANDGDGGIDLTFEWLLAERPRKPQPDQKWGDKPVHAGTQPSWTYSPGVEALAGLSEAAKDRGKPSHRVACIVKNASGEPLSRRVEWEVRLVRSNAPPQLITLEPQLTDPYRIREGERRTFTVNIYDPDEGDILTYRWALGGITISEQESCELHFLYDETDSEEAVPLRLTVTDLCGAKVERNWRIVVVNAERPLIPRDLESLP
jgi:hypothetical protein